MTAIWHSSQRVSDVRCVAIDGRAGLRNQFQGPCLMQINNFQNVNVLSLTASMQYAKVVSELNANDATVK